LYTAPDHPLSNARATISALFETGDEESRKGLINDFPQNSTERSTELLGIMVPPYKKKQSRKHEIEKARKNPFSVLYVVFRMY
jgi:hypothetical protein